MSWSIPRIWEGRVAVVIGTGLSLTEEQIAACVGRVAIMAVCDSYADVPEVARADAWLHACDGIFWEENPEAYEWPGIKTTLEPSAARDGVHLLRHNGHDGLELGDPSCVRTGGNSGHQAVNMAVHAGANPILLLGMDCKPGLDGRLHRRPGRSTTTADGGARSPKKATFDGWLRSWRTMPIPLATIGVEVWNCTPDSAIDAFPHVDLATALTRL